MDTDHTALRLLSERFGVPGIDLQQVAILVEHLGIVPEDVCERQSILPVLITDEFVFLAMANPADRQGIAMFEFATGRRVYPYVAIAETLRTTIAAAFAAQLEGQQYYLGPNVPKATLLQLGLGGQKEASPAPPVRRMSVEIPIVVMDAVMERRRDSAEITIGDFGELGDEHSTVTRLPEELLVSMPPVAIGAGKKILIVDDEDDIRALLKRLLVAKGYRIFEASRGNMALRMVKQHMPDLLILDATLPEVHGFDIAHRIKASEKYRNIPILMVSAVHKGWRVVEDVKQAYGVEEYLEKPFKIADVLTAVARLLSARHEKESMRPPRDPEEIRAEAKACLDKGVAAYKDGQIDDAIAHLKRGVDIDPLAYRLRYHLGLLYAQKKQLHDAIAQLERARELNPKHLVAARNLAAIYEMAGFKRKAVEAWELCVALAPDAATRTRYKEHLLELL